jgi:hypothetical protein
MDLMEVVAVSDFLSSVVGQEPACDEIITLLWMIKILKKWSSRDFHCLFTVNMKYL